jgi:nucleoid-associated protein YgaU
MTRDAKIGLLLGLVFIFIIAFIINGLPSLRRGDGNELTRNMANTQRTNRGIGTNARGVTHRTITPVRPTTPPTVMHSVQSEPQISQTPNEQIRFQTQLPTPSPTAGVQTQNPSVQAVLQSQAAKVAAQEPIKPTRTVKPKLSAANRTRIYKVQDGDSLASISKQLYGEEFGNKKASVDKIFKANRKILKSPDQIYVGQKLIIPPLTEAVSTSPKKVLSKDKFQRVDTIGRRHQQKTAKTVTKTRYYIVREGDSLWKIAHEQLGDGNRYPKLVKLNKLQDEDFLAVGSRLKLP